MTDIGTSELRARLSEYLDRAAGGEVIRVTHRGRPRALLAPLPGRIQLEEGIAAGWIRPAAAHPPGPWSRARGARSVAEVLREDR